MRLCLATVVNDGRLVQPPNLTGSAKANYALWRLSLILREVAEANPDKNNGAEEKPTPLPKKV